MIASILLIILIFFFIIYFFYYYKYFSNKEEENFKIIHYVPEEVNYLDLIRNLNSKFGNVDIINLNNLQFYKKNNKHILLFGNKNNTIEEIPNISCEKENFIGGYNSCISSLGNIVLLYKYSKGVKGENITWCNLKNEYIKNRNNNNTFLSQKSDLETESKSHIILTRYLYNENPAVHVNYFIQKKKEENNLLLQNFIGFLNYIKKFIKDNHIHYFSIAGRTNLNSRKWQSAINYIFKNSVYVSPGVEKKFLSESLDNEFFYTPDFICVSKNLASFGVYFYLSESVLNYTTSKILICEILKENNKKNFKSKNDHTELIYNNVIYQKQHFKKNLKIDDLEFNEIDFKNIDLKVINEYINTNKKIKTLHFYNI